MKHRNAARHRQGGQLGHACLGDEALEREVAAVHLYDRGRARADRQLVVGGARAVGRSDFDESGTALRHDVRNTEAAADLHQLAARNDRLAAVSECVQRKHEGGRAVVDDDRILGTRELAEERGAVHVPRAALAGFDIEFEIAEARRDARERIDRNIGERRTAEVRMEHHARGVDHRP